MKSTRRLCLIMMLILAAFLVLTPAAITDRPNHQTALEIGILQGVQSSSPTNNITVLPSYNFTLGGHVYAQFNAPVSNGIVKILAFNSISYAKTDSTGYFQTTLTVPPDTTDGLYHISVAFEANGQYGPSSNFTLVNVVRMPLNFTINTPSIFVSGSEGTVSGNVGSNGSALPDCAVSVTLPWNVYYGKTDASGNYQISISVPLAQFSPIAQAVISVNPVQPYIETNQTIKSIGLFNPAELIFPGIVVGVVLYEIRNLELLSTKEIKASIDFLTEKIENVGKSISSPGTVQEKLLKRAKSSRIVQIYVEALNLAAGKFRIRFVESLTIRQTVDLIFKLDKEGKGAKLFSQIAHILEDFAYTREFNESRVKDADVFLADLKVVWSMKEVS